jgi:CRP-like cAMP-binding protein
MSLIAEALFQVPFLRAVNAKDLKDSVPFWSGLTIPDGEVLWKQGAAAWQLAVLVEGRMGVLVDDMEVGEIRQGELLGEAAAFFRGVTRSATVRARGYCRVLTLPADAIKELRRRRSPVYEALIDQALLQLVQRVRATNLRIARIARGTFEAPARREKGAFEKLWRKLVPGGPKSVNPPVEDLLRAQPGLEKADPAMIGELAKFFHPQAFAEGEVICMEGDPGEAAWLIAEGQVDVLRNVRGERAERLATLKRGDQFGVNALVESGTRTASCVAATAGWAYRIDAVDFRRPKGDVGILWKEGVLATLATQIRCANSALHRVAAPTSPEDAAPSPDDFRDLLKASGFLESLPTDEAELEKLDVN